ncbi:uncharacterized protein PRCAT00005517001 [Priceomyces carsonii]|uniref:uncharacterized protein n=1 Tax=Priceomyces carsonii TaxID=28549 RepID=UPI002ED7CEF9|nr:unnamed protein product [Priceomyces carsonii]
MNKIELVTQPASTQDLSASPQESTLKKLKGLVQDNPPVEDEEKLDSQPGNETTSPSAEVERNKREGIIESAESKKRKDAAKATEPEFDDDGLEIPQGKIPLDGHFSTDEMQELISIAQSKDMISHSVKLSVIGQNEVVGDKIVISEEHQENNEDKDESEKD